jgi:hypothetical protein
MEGSTLNIELSYKSKIKESSVTPVISVAYGYDKNYLLFSGGYCVYFAVQGRRYLESAFDYVV